MRTVHRLALEVRFDLAPIGATRFAELVQAEFFTNNVRAQGWYRFGVHPDRIPVLPRYPVAQHSPLYDPPVL